MWDVEQNISTNTMFGHVQGIWDLAADKLRIATASHDRTIKIWDTDAGKCMVSYSFGFCEGLLTAVQHTLVGHRGAVLTVKMTDDRLLSGSDDNDIVRNPLLPRYISCSCFAAESLEFFSLGFWLYYAIRLYLRFGILIAHITHQASLYCNPSSHTPPTSSSLCEKMLWSFFELVHV